jgi:hypothetical protein
MATGRSRLHTLCRLMLGIDLDAVKFEASGAYCPFARKTSGVTRSKLATPRRTFYKTILRTVCGTESKPLIPTAVCLADPSQCAQPRNLISDEAHFETPCFCRYNPGPR